MSWGFNINIRNNKEHQTSVHLVGSLGNILPGEGGVAAEPLQQAGDLDHVLLLVLFALLPLQQVLTDVECMCDIFNYIFASLAT
jgi:hypothetical protein